jgi:uridylate kinase
MIKNLRIMDQTAFALCKENKMPIIVFNIKQRGNILRILQGEKIGTLVS